MIDEFGNAPKKGGQIAKAVLIPGIAFAAWYFFSFLVGNAAAFLFAAYEANKHPGADEETLKNLIYTVYDKNISLLYIIGAALFIIAFYLIYRRTHFTRSININTRKIGGPLEIGRAHV